MALQASTLQNSSKAVMNHLFLLQITTQYSRVNDRLALSVHITDINCTFCKKKLVKLTNIHQTSHLCVGFIGEPAGHLKSFANSSLFEKGPWTRNIPGEWAPVFILFSSDLSRYFEHQVLAALIQNI